MNTNKYIQLIALWAIVLIGLSGCDTTLDVNEKITGYYTVKVNFAHPQNEVLFPSYGSKYVAILDGDTLQGGEGFVSRAGAAKKLEIVKQGETKPEFSQDITVTQNSELQLIKLGDRPIEFFDASKYIQFKPVVILLKGATGYNVSFNGIELQNGILNYIPKAETTGKLEIHKEGVKEPLISQEATVADGDQTNIMQLSETDFLFIPKDTEEAPESNQYTKIRFFYTPDAFPGVSKTKIVVYEWTNFTELGSVEMNAGELSPYLLIDWSKGDGLYHAITNAETGEVLIDGNVNEAAWINTGKGVYKFATSRIPVGGVVIETVENLSTRW